MLSKIYSKVQTKGYPTKLYHYFGTRFTQRQIQQIKIIYINIIVHCIYYDFIGAYLQI